MAKHVEYENVGSEYLEHRQLKRGAAGWVLLAGLGVSYVISGDFAGWNFGLAQGGWGGLLVATILMGAMYTCMVFGLAELAAALPVAGAGYGFARRALGPLGGFATGIAILVEYAIAPAAIVVFIGDYVQALGLFGLTSSWPVYLVCYVLFVGVHLYGVGEALRLMFVITGVAVVALVAFIVGMIPKFDSAKLFDIGDGSFLPMGVTGALGALVYAIWFFLAVEGVPLAAEEARDPKKDMPRGIIGAMLALLVFAALILVFAPGGAGAKALMSSGNPLPEAVRAAYGGDNFLAQLVNYVGLAGLVASFFSIIYAYSRQLFALSRAGYLPRWLSKTGKRKTPYLALIVPGTIGFALASIMKSVDPLTGGARLINIAVFGAALSYVLMMVSHIVLRVREPEMQRPYRTPGGVVTTGVALVLAVAAVIATFFVDKIAAGVTAAIVIVALAYFWFYSRHHLVANAPEEEFAAIARAEAELDD
ncbi:ethanolamine permease [Lentzea tibetensis]|uniref:Ethanolamine permease n=1 Tax=Lentzea tibetensis TaxID=2591470 RepID=A0A563EVT7_9PSEU|nr:ethanolamine permease [Lentzea tibetensis]TWP51810.1 ethanolamine permease [Lentzea tibetensis]